MSDTIDDLVARLTRLEDLEAIRHTWRDYCIRLDSADWSALGDVFTEDFLNAYVDFRREQVSDLNSRPHPYELHMYYDD